MLLPRLTALFTSLGLCAFAQAAPTQYPLTIDNCGTPLTFDHAPTRTVTIGQAGTEMLYGLGLGNKVAARAVAVAANVPVVPATGALPDDIEACKQLAAEVGYPLMLKASWGGGGRGMRVIETETDLAPMKELAQREAVAAFGNGEVYLEKLIRRARHVEVQVLGDGRWGHLSGQVGDEPCLQLIIQRNDDAWMQAPPGFFS